jgi:uncharacterized membrane protein YhaH (DUF805 family)
MSDFVRHFYFSPRGRTSRQFYWLFGALPLFVLGILLGTMVLAARPYVSPLVLLVFMLGVVILAVWSGAAISIRRLHDFGVRGWWMLVAFALSLAVAYFVSLLAGHLLSLISWIVVGVVPGTRGINEFGPDPGR